MPGTGAFDESLHPRADDGKFGGGGKPRSPKAADTVRKGKAKIAATKATMAGLDKLSDREGHFLKAINGKAPARDFKNEEATSLRESIQSKLGLGHGADLRAVAKAHEKATTGAKAPKEPAKAGPKPIEIDHAALDAELAESTRRLEEARAKAGKKINAERAPKSEPKKPPAPEAVKPAAPEPKPEPPKAAEPEDHGKIAADASKEAWHAVGESLRHSALAGEAAEDGDHAAAKQHLATAQEHMAKAKSAQQATRAAADRAGTAEADNAAEEAGMYLDHGNGSIAKAQSLMENMSHAKANTDKNAVKSGEYNALAREHEKMWSPDEKRVLRMYSDTIDRSVNGMLRSSGGKIDEAHLPTDKYGERQGSIVRNKHVETLDAAIAKTSLPRDMTVYRVVKSPPGGVFDGLKEGSSFTDHGFSSTTGNKALLDKFEGAIKDTSGKEVSGERMDFHISLKKGSQGAAMNDVSAFQGEKEILLPRGSKFRVTKIVPASGGQPKQIHVERV